MTVLFEDLPGERSPAGHASLALAGVIQSALWSQAGRGSSGDLDLKQGLLFCYQNIVVLMGDYVRPVLALSQAPPPISQSRPRSRVAQARRSLPGPEH